MREADDSVYEFGQYQLRVAERRLLRDGEPVVLSPKVYETLLLLVENSGRAVEKDTFLEKIWRDAFVEEGILAVNISILRKTLGEKQNGDKYIETIPRVGYRFTSNVKILAAENGKTDAQSTTQIQTIISEHSTNVETNLQEKLNPENNGAAYETDRRNKTDRRAITDRRVATQVGLTKNRAIVSVVILLLVALSVAAYFRFRAQVSKQIESIAVLPFANVSGDANVDYLTDGLTENIINKLARIPRLKIPARATVSRYKSKEIDPLKAASELGVNAVMVGRILKEGDALNISVELIETRTGNLIWGETYTRKMTDLLFVQDEITRRVVENSNVKLSTEEQSRLAKRYTDNPQAYELYLRGRFFWRKWTEVGFQKAIDNYNQAIKLDPNFALAYSGLADCYRLYGNFGFGPPKEYSPKAKEYAIKALEIDDGLAEAHTSLAFTKYFFDWDWAGAEKEFKRAIELNPSYSQAHRWYSSYLVTMRRFDEALREINLSKELDPLTQYRAVGIILYSMRRYDEAIYHLNKAQEISPDNYSVHIWLSGIYQIKGMKDKSLQEQEKSCALIKTDSPESLWALLCTRIDFKQGWVSHMRQVKG